MELPPSPNPHICRGNGRRFLRIWLTDHRHSNRLPLPPSHCLPLPPTFVAVGLAALGRCQPSNFSPIIVKKILYLNGERRGPYGSKTLKKGCRFVASTNKSLWIYPARPASCMSIHTERYIIWERHRGNLSRVICTQEDFENFGVEGNKHWGRHMYHISETARVNYSGAWITHRVGPTGLKVEGD